MYSLFYLVFFTFVSAVHSQWQYFPLRTLSMTTVKHADQLQCHFDEPCMWGTSNTTSNNWKNGLGYTDLVWWIEHVKTIRTPDKAFGVIELKENENGDELLSNIIKCQESDGLLKFDYYASENMKVKACLMNATINEVIQCSAFFAQYPPISGASFSVPGPINSPFQLSIKTELKPKSSGFVTVDNIGYSAVMCNEKKTNKKLPIIKTSEIIDQRKFNFIESTDKLVCDFSGDWPCRWGPLGGNWELLDYIPNLKDLQTNEEPTLPSALLKQSQGRFISDPIKCQLKAAQVMLRWWSTPGVSVEVCAVKVANASEKIVCSAPYSADNRNYPGPVVIEYKTKIDEPFEIHIIPIWNQAVNDGYLIIDDLAYFADICNVTTNKELKTGTQTLPKMTNLEVIRPTPLTLITGSIDGERYRFIGRSDDLVCDFSDQFPCNWGAIGGEWVRIYKSPKSAIINTINQPVLPAAMIYEGNSKMVSHPVKCQKGEGQVILKAWTTNKVSFLVCASSLESGTLLQCSRTHNSSTPGYPGPFVLKFPESMTEAFEWQIIPVWNSTEPDGYIIVDELAYFGDICDGEDNVKKTVFEFDSRIAAVPSSTKNPTIIKPKRTTDKSIDQTDLCTFLPCDFNDDFCHYYQLGRSGTTVWLRRNRPIGRPLTRITDIRMEQDIGYYVAALMRANWRSLAILESPQLQIITKDTLKMRIFRPSASTTLRICFETIKNNTAKWKTEDFHKCQQLTPKLTANNARKWFEAKVVLQPSFTKFYLVAENVGRKGSVGQAYGAIAIDNIDLESCNKS